MPKYLKTATEYSGTEATEKIPHEDEPSDPSSKAEDATPDTTLAVEPAEEKEDKGWDDRQTKMKTKPEGKQRKLPKAENK